MAPPGVVIDRSPDPQKVFLGSPSIAVLPDGTYVASHDFFGPGTDFDTTAVFRSGDRGETWERTASLKGQFWSLLFTCGQGLYIIGSSSRWSSLVVRRSDDGGRSWTEPRDGDCGLIVPEDDEHLYGIAPGALLEHEGRVWKHAARRKRGPRRWEEPKDFMVLSAPLDADLLKAGSWSHTRPLHCVPRPPEPWLCGEGNVVPGPDGGLRVVIRVDERGLGGIAGLMDVSPDGRDLSFDPESGFIDFPGGCKKFTVRRDPESGLYWSLSNWAQEGDREKAVNVERQRNTLALIASRNLRDWEVRSVVLYHPDVRTVGFQYADWLFDGRDMIAVVRTAFDGARNCHDANYFTFHRIPDFRDRAMSDQPLNALAAEREA